MQPPSAPRRSNPEANGGKSRRRSGWLRSSARGLVPVFACMACSARAADGLSGASLEDLMNVRVTTVSREESTVARSPAAVFVITPEMIDRSGATTIPELLRMVPGLSISHIDSSKWAVGSRGFADRFVGKLQVQIDGRSVYTPVNGGVYWDTFDYPLQDIERIEVIRGPGASMWGADAVNGIINVVTKPAKDTQGGLLSVGGGTEVHGMSTLRWGGKIHDQLHYRAYGKWFENGTGYNTKGDARDDWRQGRFGFRMDWQPHPEDSLLFSGEYFIGLSGRRDLRASPTSPSTYIVTNTEDEESKGGNLNLRWTHDFSKDSKSVWQMYYDSFRRRGTGGTFDFSVNTFDIDFQYEFRLGERQKLVLGGQYKLENIAWQGSTGFDGGFATRPAREYVQRPLLGVFVHDEIEIVHDRFAIMLGAKLEHNEYTGFEFQPNARLLWTPTKKQTLWASVSRAVRTPTFLENDIGITTLPSTPRSGRTVFPRITGNALLNSEELIAYEFGYRAQLTDKVSLDAALFYNTYDKLFTTESGATYVDAQTGALTLPVNRSNRGRGETCGADIAVTWRITDWWRLTGSYSYLKMNLHADPSLAASSAAGFERIEGQSPQNQVYLRSSFDLPSHVQFDITGRYSDALPGFTPGIPAYFTMDARLAWKPKPNLEFTIVGQNLLDNAHPEFGTSTLVRSPIVEVQRSLYGMITWKF